MLINLLENLLTNLIEPLIEGGESDGFLAFTFGGNIPYYTLYTREGDATAELPDGTPATVAQDTPPYEYDSGRKLFRQSYSTDNPGTTSLQINDIETGAYEFNGTSDYITRSEFPEITTDNDFSICFSFNYTGTTIERAIITNRINNQNGFAIAIDSTGVLNCSFFNGSSFVNNAQSTSPLTPGTYKAIYSNDGSTASLYLNTINQTSGSGAASLGGQDMFEIGAADSNRFYNSPIFDVYLLDRFITSVDVTAYQNGEELTNYVERYKLNQYRRDTVVIGENGNHGTSARNVDLMLIENQGFGVPGEDARKTFTYERDDGPLDTGLLIALPQTGTTFDPQFVLTSGTGLTEYADGTSADLEDPPVKTFPVDEARTNYITFSEPLGVTFLYLHTNQLSGSIPAELGNLSNLQYLYLDNNQLSGSIPAELGNLSNLTHLYLYTNQLSGSIPAELGNLNNVQYLYLNANQLSGSIPAELGNLNNLQYLYLDNNQFSQNDLSNFVTVLWSNRVTFGSNSCVIKIENNNGLTSDAIARIEGTGDYLNDGLKQAGCTVTY